MERSAALIPVNKLPAQPCLLLSGLSGLCMVVCDLDLLLASHSEATEELLADDNDRFLLSLRLHLGWVGTLTGVFLACMGWISTTCGLADFWGSLSWLDWELLRLVTRSWRGAMSAGNAELSALWLKPVSCELAARCQWLTRPAAAVAAVAAEWRAASCFRCSVAERGGFRSGPN